MKPELIVALDLPSAAEAHAAVSRIGSAVAWYKVGLELYTAEGMRPVEQLLADGRRVFLDLKLHDIPRTVAHAVTSAARHRIDLLTVHAHGGRDMLRAAAEAAREAGPRRPRLLAITTLTSLNQDDLLDLGITRPLADHSRALAEMAIGCGIDGLVCSVHEAAALRRVAGPGALIVVPGIRPAGADVADQKRVGTPGDAVRAGATHLVVGRPILSSPDPAAAARAVLAEIEAAAA